MVEIFPFPLSRPHRRAAVAALLSGLGMAGAAHAQVPQTQVPQTQASPARTTGTTVLAPVVVTGTKTPTQGYQPVTSSTATLTDKPVLDVPQSVNTVSQEVLRDQKATSLDDALGNVSGIVQTNTLGGTQDAFIKRGFGENRDGSILTGGLKTVLPRSFNATTERVEVLKGPSSTLYGILDPGGLINVIPKRPESAFSGSLTATGSSFGGGSTALDVTGPVSGTGFSYRLIGDYQHAEYWRDYGANKRALIAPSVSWTGEDTSVTLSYMHVDYSVPFDRGTIFDLGTGKAVPVDRKTRFDEPFNITQGWSDLAQVSVAHDLNRDWKLRVDYSYSQDKYSDNQARVMAYAPATGNLTRRVDATQGSTQKQHAVRADVQGNVEIGGFRNELLAGVAYDNYDLLRTNMIRCANTGGFNIYTPVYGRVRECATVAAAESDQTIQQKSYSAYLQDSLHLTDQWILVGGVRYHYYDQMAGRGRPFRMNTDAGEGKFVPRVGLVYKATPSLSFYANYAHSFTPQSSIATYIGTLPPEKGVSYEVGAKADLFRGLTGTVALYHTDKENVLYTETIGGVNYAKTAGRVRARGFEIDLAGRLTEDLSLIASYGFTDARVMEDPDYSGKRPSNIARHTGSLFLAYDAGPLVGNDRLRFGGGVRGVSKRAGTPGNTYDLPAYAVADAFAAYTLPYSQPVTVQLNLKNIFDKTYYTSSIGTNNLGNQIGEPFQALVSLKVDF